MEFTREEFDPESAQAALKTNTGNRHLNPSHVQKLRREMDEGRWVDNGEAIKFDNSGRLIDGQHRLSAIALMPPEFRITLTVVRGLDSAAQLTMDLGRKRTAGDFLTMSGYAQGNRLAAAVRFLIDWREHKSIIRKGTPTSDTTIVAWVRTHEDLVEQMQEDGVWHLTMALEIEGRVINGFMLYAYETGFGGTAYEFLRLLHSLENLPANSPVLALRKKLMDARANRVKLTSRDHLGFLLVGWSKWLTNKSWQHPKIPVGGWTTEFLMAVPTPKES